MHSSENDKERSNRLILGFFFLTGLTGLAYELVWIRLLILAFGSTQFAITTVLVVFMAGLALGSFIFGRIIDRNPTPLKVYAFIEVGLGLYCILSPAIFGLVKTIYLGIGGGETAIHYASFEPAQFALSFAALIIPATLMGGTLPVLVKYLASASGRVGFHTAIPYAINTLGAVSGCLITGFFSLYILGVTTTIYVAGAIDIVIGILVFGLFARSSVTLKESARLPSPMAESLSGDRPPLGPSRTLGAVIIGAFALSGFASLAYEVLWTRVFSLVLGSSVYAFTIMLSTFLAGIGFGSLLFAPVVDRLKRPVAWFGALEAVIGFSALFSILLYKRLPLILYELRGDFSERFWIFQLLQFFLCAAIMIIPTLAMGAIFPLVGRIYTKSLKNVGAKIGEIYFFNTTGSIFGAFAGGFILIPLLGVQKSVVLIAAFNICIAITLLLYSGVKGYIKGAAAVAFAVVFIVTAILMPPWEKMMMTMGLYINPVEKRASLEEIIYYKEGINAIITVRRAVDGTISYQANGKTEASSKDGEPGPAWSLLGHIPLLLHEAEAERALLVGLGSGITLGAMERYGLKSIDVVEIEPAVIDAAGYFSEANFNALDDPRVKLHVTDGRNFVFAAETGYDIIVSAVSDPWISGVSNLFTYEYFDELKKKLNPGGVVSLWFQNYRITPKELKIGLNTFASVFPNVSIWFHYTDSLDLIIIGSVEEHTLDMARLERVFKDQGLSDALGRIGIMRPMDLFDLFIMGDKDLRRYAGAAMLNTDERPIYEFALPKLLYMDPALATETLKDIFSNVEDFVAPVIIPADDKESFYLALGRSFNRYSFRMEQSLKIFEHLVDMNPENREARTWIKSLKKDLRSTSDKDIKR
jgi:spermidine synthase